MFGVVEVATGSEGVGAWLGTGIGMGNDAPTGLAEFWRNPPELEPWTFGRSNGNRSREMVGRTPRGDVPACSLSSSTLLLRVNMVSSIASIRLSRVSFSRLRSLYAFINPSRVVGALGCVVWAGFGIHTPSNSVPVVSDASNGEWDALTLCLSGLGCLLGRFFPGTF